MSKPAGVRGIIEYQGKYLLVKNKSSQADFWCLPGGSVEENEAFLEALEREMIEETGIKPVIGNLLFVHQVKIKDGWSIPGLYFHIKNSKDYLNIDITKTSHGELELNDIDFVDIANAFVLPEFLKTELPKLKKLDFVAPAQFKLDSFDFIS
jgi:ADP-ribose pyrophosphatase YjhB (NUDIX family)